MNLQTRNASNPKDAKKYDTNRLREEFFVEKLFVKEELNLTYSHFDRIIFGGAFPIKKEVTIDDQKILHTEFFLERREMGIINIGGSGVVIADNQKFEMSKKDCLYLSMGTKEIKFISNNENEPAKFYICSAPAHKEYPTVMIPLEKAESVPMGSVEDCNKRTINKYFAPTAIQSCQLMMGLTELEVGSVWNTMPSHTHDRRMEVYMYFDMKESTKVFHMMGEPTETRHIVMSNEQAVISPSWSIHSGCGTSNYSFIWAMCGENQIFADMDAVKMNELR